MGLYDREGGVGVREIKFEWILIEPELGDQEHSILGYRKYYWNITPHYGRRWYIKEHH